MDTTVGSRVRDGAPDGCAAGRFGGTARRIHLAGFRGPPHRPGMGLPLNTYFCASATGS